MTDEPTAEPTTEGRVPAPVKDGRHTRAGLTVTDVDEARGVVVGRLFPFGERAHIREVLDGELFDYEEQFLPGCTTRLRQLIERGLDPRFITYQLDHEAPGIDARLGYGVALDEREDGAYAHLQLYRNRSNYELVREMLVTSHRGMSVQFSDHVAPRVEGRIVSRRQVNIHHVAAVTAPAYASAGVVAMRSADEAPAASTPNLDRARAMLDSLRT
jgi:hypothetical protein